MTDEVGVYAEAEGYEMKRCKKKIICHLTTDDEFLVLDDIILAHIQENFFRLEVKWDKVKEYNLFNKSCSYNISLQKPNGETEIISVGIVNFLEKGRA